MNLSEVGADFGSCGVGLGRNLIRILQNRPEVVNSYQDRAREGGYGEEVGRQGHPPNFVRPSIEGEQKFGGWICPRWVPSSSKVGAEFGSCYRSTRAILIGILQNRQEMQFSRMDRPAHGSYGVEVGRQGHPPNFVRPSIEGEHKFGG